MGIQALPDTTVRALGANQVLTDPASLVKELIDNAIDANATIIAIEIHSNTVDTIQVRDNGHGVAPEDRPLVARRYCTSKLSHDDQLSAVSASSLGFRGEALAAAAELSGSLTISTRIEGEQVAVAMKIDTKGEVVSQEKASLPVGTTARITDFIKANPVRRQLALKNADSCLKKIKRLLQSYAFARPHVRLSVRVLKAKNSNKIDWVYAPKLNGNAEDTAFKVVGAACASQCTWSVLEEDGFSLQAFLPRPDSDPSKISNISAFISLDGRPVSASKGAFKDICKAYRAALKSASGQFQDTKDPFLYLDITSPPGSYDANSEPAKDDVVFENRNMVIGIAKKLFEAVYAHPEEQQERPETADLPRRQLQQDLDDYTASPLAQSDNFVSSRNDSNVGLELGSIPGVDKEPERGTELPALAGAEDDRPRFRGNMYGCDDEELDLMDIQPANTGESEMDELQQVRNDITASNPWIMAKMNAPARRPGPTADTSPTMHAADGMMSSSPLKQRSRAHGEPTGLPTPRPSSPSPSILDDEQDRIVRPRDGDRGSPPLPPPQPYAQMYPVTPYTSERPTFETPIPPGGDANSTWDHSSMQAHDSGLGTSLRDIPDVSAKPRRSPQKQRARSNVNKPFVPPMKERPQQEKVWFDHLEHIERPRANPKPRRSQNTGYNSDGLVTQGELGGLVQEPSPLTPPRRNRDIRDFVGGGPSSASASGEAIGRSVRSDRVRDSLDVELLDLTRDAEVGGQQRGFVAASKLLEMGEPSQADDETSRRPPKRRKTSERRALQELSTNAPLADAVQEEREEDAEYRPETGKRAASRRKASRKLSRRETLKLPLERTPQGQCTHTLVLKLRASARDIAAMARNVDMERTCLDLNEPALPAPKGLDDAFPQTLSLVADLHRLLINAGSDTDAPGPEKLLAEVKAAFKSRAENIDRDEETLLDI